VHDNSSTIGPVVHNDLVKSAILSITNSAALEDKVSYGMELRVFLNCEDDGELQDGCLETLGLVCAEVQVEVDTP